jgi:hypothetical protein
MKINRKGIFNTPVLQGCHSNFNQEKLNPWLNLQCLCVISVAQWEAKRSYIKIIVCSFFMATSYSVRRQWTSNIYEL